MLQDLTPDVDLSPDISLAAHLRSLGIDPDMLPPNVLHPDA